jgi:hypothetical protein
MNEIKLDEVDKEFDFDAAYKRNYCTLLNISVMTKDLQYCFKVDMIEESLKYPQTLHMIVYREWQNKNWFELRLCDEDQNLFWSSAEKAMQWFEERVSEFGLERVTKEQAYQVALLSI